MTNVFTRLNAADLAALDPTCRTLHKVVRDPHFSLPAEHLWQKVLDSWWKDDAEDIRVVVQHSQEPLEQFIFSGNNEAVMLHRASMITQRIINHSTRCFDDKYLLAFNYDQCAIWLLTNWLAKEVATKSQRFVAWKHLITMLETGKEGSRSFLSLASDHLTALASCDAIERTARHNAVSTFLALLCAQHNCQPPEVDATAITRATWAIQEVLSHFDKLVEEGALETDDLPEASASETDEQTQGEDWPPDIDIYPRHPNGNLSSAQHDAHVANLAAILEHRALFWMSDIEEPWASTIEADAKTIALVAAAYVPPDDAAALSALLASRTGTILESAYSVYADTVADACAEDIPWRPMEVAIEANDVSLSNNRSGQM